MKRYITVLFLCALLTGCCGLNAAFVKATDDSWQVIGPEYEAYVAGDAKLDEGTKKIRLNSAKTFTALIDEAKLSVAEEAK